MKSRILAGACTLVGFFSTAHAQHIVDMRTAAAKPGACQFVPADCGYLGKWPVVRSDCKMLRYPSGQPFCQTPVSYWCGVGFQPVYLSKAKQPYFREADTTAFDEKITAWKLATPEGCRPPRGAK